MKIKLKKVLLSITRISLTVIGIIFILYYSYVFWEQKQVDDKLKDLKASTARVFVVFNNHTMLEKHGVQFPSSSVYIKLFHTGIGKNFDTHNYNKSPLEVVMHCGADGKAYEITGNAIKELFSAIEFNKNQLKYAKYKNSINPKLLFFSKENKLLACFYFKYGQFIESTFLDGSIALTKTSQEKMKMFFIKHKLPVQYRNYSR